MAKQAIKEKFQILEQNIKNLKKFKESISLEDLHKKKFDEWALRYGFIESIQIIIDISCHFVSYYNLGKPSNYSECVEIIAKYDYITSEMAKKLIGMIGLRNLLIHEYTTIDLDILYGLLENLDEMAEFVSKMKSYI